MPTVEENKRVWTTQYDWPEGGDEWSEPWGGSQYLWFGTIFPRIQAFVPAGNILEIAPGFGRCTQHLLTLCDKLTVVDLTERCIESCKKRFSSFSHITYCINDGYSLDMIEDDSIDFVFSWDSLVHVESDVMASYVKQLSKKLKQGGAGFIHHSNAAHYTDAQTGKLTVKNEHWRGVTMSAALFREYCAQSGIRCVAQELVPWRVDYLSDCFSFFVKDGQSGISTNVYENNDFRKEADNLKRISEFYKLGSSTPKLP